MLCNLLLLSYFILMDFNVFIESVEFLIDFIKESADPTCAYWLKLLKSFFLIGSIFVLKQFNQDFINIGVSFAYNINEEVIHNVCIISPELNSLRRVASCKERYSSIEISVYVFSFFLWWTFLLTIRKRFSWDQASWFIFPEDQIGIVIEFNIHLKGVKDIEFALTQFNITTLVRNWTFSC